MPMLSNNFVENEYHEKLYVVVCQRTAPFSSRLLCGWQGVHPKLYSLRDANAVANARAKAFPSDKTTRYYVAEAKLAVDFAGMVLAPVKKRRSVAV